MKNLENYLSIDNVKCKGFSEQEICQIQAFTEYSKAKYVTPEFIQGCADAIGCSVGMLIGGENLILIKVEEVIE